MYDYSHIFTGTGETTPVLTSQLPTEYIPRMIAYIDDGEPVGLADEPEWATRESIRERLVLELEIRSMEGRL